MRTLLVVVLLSASLTAQGRVGGQVAEAEKPDPQKRIEQLEKELAEARTALAGYAGARAFPTATVADNKMVISCVIAK